MCRRLRRAERLSVRARIKRNPPLPQVYETQANRLARFMQAARPADARAIGVRLDMAGGVPLMRYVARRADALSLQHGNGPLLEQLELVWAGIGDWAPAGNGPEPRAKMGHGKPAARRRDPAA